MLVVAVLLYVSTLPSKETCILNLSMFLLGRTLSSIILNGLKFLSFAMSLRGVNHMSTFSPLLFHSLFLLHTIRNEFVKRPLLLLCVITLFQLTELRRKRVQDKVYEQFSRKLSLKCLEF